MTPDQSIPLVSAMLLTGSSAWHPDYQRVVDYAALCRKLATGDVSSLLRPYWESESEADFAKLLGLYVATCDSVWGELSSQFYKVARLRDGQVERKLTYDEAVGEAERARRTERVTQALEHYYNDAPLQDYLAERIVQTVAMTDPNAWVLTAFDAFDFRTERAQPYPVLLPCEAVVDFTRSAGKITSMSARFVFRTADDTQSLYRYTTYLPDYAVDYWPVDGQGVATIPGGPEAASGVVVDAKGVVHYHYQVLEHGAGRVPASPIGYVPDQGATGLVFVSPLHRAIGWLRLELKTGHELQIVMRNMASPRQLQYVQPCTGYPSDGGCTYGQCTTPQHGDRNDLTCRKCGGSGQTVISQSSRDVITVPLSPDPAENKLKLTDYLAFVGPDPAIPDFQLKFQDWISDKLKQLVFGTQALTKTDGPVTATERVQMADQMAVTLSPFADQFSALYIHHGLVIAVYVDAGDGLSIIYDFPEGLDLKSERDLYDQLEAANKAGVRPDEIARIQTAIMRKTHASDPEALRRYLVRSRFIPTLGLSDATAIQIFVLGQMTQDDFVTRFNADRVFMDAEQANPRFYDLGYAQQAELVQAQVELIKGKLSPATASGGSFGRLNLQPSAPAAPVTA